MTVEDMTADGWSRRGGRQNQRADFVSARLPPGMRHLDVDGGPDGQNPSSTMTEARFDDPEHLKDRRGCPLSRPHPPRAQHDVTPSTMFATAGESICFRVAASLVVNGQGKRLRYHVLARA